MFNLNYSNMVVPQKIIIFTDTPQVEQSIWSVYNDCLSVRSNINTIQPLLGEDDEVWITGDDGETYTVRRNSWE